MNLIVEIKNIEEIKNNKNLTLIYKSKKIDIIAKKYIKYNILNFVAKPTEYICIEANNNYNYMKFILKILKKLNQKKNYKIAIINNGDKYLNDLKAGIQALNISNKSARYEFIYDYVCDYLDSKFTMGICDFKNDACYSNRKGCDHYKKMGCCYSFEYTKLFEPGFTKNLKQCEHLVNKRCQEKNISCKLYTCDALKKDKKFKFNTRRILLLDCFFNERQHLILKNNFFKTKKEILEKLEEKNYLPFLYYYSTMKFLIKTDKNNKKQSK